MKNGADNEIMIYGAKKLFVEYPGLKIVGQIKDMIIWGDENIYPREIKELLYAHLAVPDIQVFAVPDKKYGRNW